MFNFYKSIAKSRTVQGKISIDDFLKGIKEGNALMNTIQKARTLYSLGYMEEYNNIKRRKLSAFTLNFTFNERRANENIIQSTGYIYLDLDGDISISKNSYVFATWKSLSENGRGILVKTTGVTKENFSYNYDLISKELEVSSDRNAAKPTQINVLSYDPSLYVNSNSIVWSAKEKAPQNSEYETNTHIVKNVLGHFSSENLRLDNLEEFVADLDFKNEDILDYGEPVFLSKVYTKFNIPEGRRYTTLNGQGYQYRALNKGVSEEQLSSFLFTQNRFRCKPPLSDDEVYKILNNVLAIPEENLSPVRNWRRRYFFNPDSQISLKSKKQLVIQEVNKRRRLASLNAIEEAIKEWDFSKQGKITNKKLVIASGKSKNTVEKYKIYFQDEIKQLNEYFKKEKHNLSIRPP